MNAFDLILFVIKTFLLSHIVLLVVVIGGTLLVLSVVFLGTGPAVVAFLRSRVGQIIVALVAAGIVGWELKGYVDDSVALQRQLVTERREAAAALAAETARTKVALHQADEARRQAEAQRAIATTAAANEAKARADAETAQEDADDYADELADAKRHPADERHGFALRESDVRGLLGLGTARRRRP